MAFEGLKSYIGFALLVNKPESREELYMYLMVSAAMISSVFVRDEGKI